MAAEERVLCFKRQLLDEIGAFQGLSFEVDKYLPVFTSPANLIYQNRSEAEQDKRYKQLIPYVLLVHAERVLQYRRGKGGQENRLHGLLSIGVGGHISDEDAGLFSAAGYYDGMWRELREEVDIEPLSEATVAVLNDDSTDVGTVHFGVVHIVRVGDESAVGSRKGIVSPEFISIPEAIRNATNYESWSRLCLENFDEILTRAAAVSRVPQRAA